MDLFRKRPQGNPNKGLPTASNDSKLGRTLNMFGPINAPPSNRPIKPGNRARSAISGPNTTINATTVNPKMDDC